MFSFDDFWEEGTLPQGDSTYVSMLSNLYHTVLSNVQVGNMALIDDTMCFRPAKTKVAIVQYNLTKPAVILCDISRDDEDMSIMKDPDTIRRFLFELNEAVLGKEASDCNRSSEDIDSLANRKTHRTLRTMTRIGVKRQDPFSSIAALIMLHLIYGAGGKADYMTCAMVEFMSESISRANGEQITASDRAADILAALAGKESWAGEQEAATLARLIASMLRHGDLTITGTGATALAVKVGSMISALESVVEENKPFTPTVSTEKD